MKFHQYVLSYLRRIARFINRKRLKNSDFSLITNECTGGVISHDLHLKFKSPTVNLYFHDEEFILFCEHLTEYLQLDLVQDDSKDLSFPVGVLQGKYGEVHIYFMHYSTFDEANVKWNERKKRVNFERIYVIMHMPEFNEDLIRRFSKIPIKNKVVITSKHMNLVAFGMKKGFYEKSYYPGKILDYSPLGLYRYLDDFDYVKFFNKGEICRRSRLF